MSQPNKLKSLNGNVKDYLNFYTWNFRTYIKEQNVLGIIPRKIGDQKFCWERKQTLHRNPGGNPTTTDKKPKMFFNIFCSKLIEFKIILQKIFTLHDFTWTSLDNPQRPQCWQCTEAACCSRLWDLKMENSDHRSYFFSRLHAGHHCCGKLYDCNCFHLSKLCGYRAVGWQSAVINLRS